MVGEHGCLSWIQSIIAAAAIDRALLCASRLLPQAAVPAGRAARGGLGQIFRHSIGRTEIAIACALALSILAANAKADRLELVAGGGAKVEGPAAECKLTEPFACGKDSKGTLYIAEMAGRVLAVDPSGRLRRVAGGKGEGSAGDNGPARDSQLNAPHNLLVLPGGDVLVADTMNHRVRKIIAKSGRIVPFAGTGAAGFGGDGGPALAATFGAIYCLALDARRDALYLDDLDNHRIRKIDLKTGMVTTVAGNGQRGVPKDGSIAIEAPLQDPRAIACDSKGNLYILERSGNALRVVDTGGRIKTVVGTGKAGPAEDSPALAATLRGPKHLIADHDDNILIADTDNHMIRKFVVAESRIVRVCGTGAAGADGIGAAPETAHLNLPHGVYVDSRGTIYICDSWNGRVLRIVRE